jgi:hypothetical protein
VTRERVEHVVEELDVGVDLDRAAVKPETQIDLRLFGRPFDDGPAVAQERALPAGSRPRSAIGSNGCTSGPV